MGWKMGKGKGFLEKWEKEIEDFLEKSVVRAEQELGAPTFADISNGVRLRRGRKSAATHSGLWMLVNPFLKVAPLVATLGWRPESLWDSVIGSTRVKLRRAPG